MVKTQEGRGQIDRHGQPLNNHRPKFEFGRQPSHREGEVPSQFPYNLELCPVFSGSHLPPERFQVLISQPQLSKELVRDG